MTLHVFAVGDPDDPVLTAAFDAAVETDELKKIRAGDPEELLSRLVELVARLGPIDVLDIYDHGNPGEQAFGRPVQGEKPLLFKSDDSMSAPLTGVDPKRFDPLLGRHAQVRLIGCEVGATSNTAVPRSVRTAGRALLLKLAHALGRQREVLASVVPVVAAAFDEHGFSDGPARESLYSSHAAWDGEPQDRIKSIALLKSLGFPPH